MREQDLPESIRASIALYREDPTAWRAEWQRNHDFKVGLIERAKKAEAALAAMTLARHVLWDYIYEYEGMVDVLKDNPR